MIDNSNISEVLSIVRKAVSKFERPAVSVVANRDPFKVLIATILSARTKDEVTIKASRKLFSAADNPQDMLKLGEEKISELIYPVGFYRNKAKNIVQICKELVEKYNGKVPDTMEELLKLKGVGRKTANLVLILGYDKMGICVDTHVHRITNRWGYVKTRTPEETEMELRKKLPKKHWKEINELLVSFGQHICKPVKPQCNTCPVQKLCPRIGVR
ncbi:MAG: endonuclease III [Candidatus Baldrarchaeia archaeon]